MKFKYVIASLGLSLVLSSCGQVPAPTLESISLSGTYQTEYVVGEAYNSTGLVVTAKYNDESTKQVADYTVSGFDSSTVGQKTVVITYQQKTANYTVNVSAVDPTHIDITINVTVSGIDNYANNHSYIYMYQKFASNEWSFTPMKNTSGHLWTATFNQVKVGKSYEYNFYYGDDKLPDLVNGKNVITGSSRTMTVTFDKLVYPLNANFNVVEPQVSTLDSISLTGTYKTTYKLGEALDLEGLIVMAHYSDNSTRIVSNYSNSGFDSTTKGTCDVVISYTENNITKTAGFKATITNPLKNIAIKTKPNKTTYEYGEEFSKTGLIVTATYEDNTSKDVTTYEVSGYDKTLIGEQTLTVSYTEEDITKTATFTVKVVNSVVSIEVVHLPDVVEYLPGDELDTTGLVVAATLKNGTKALVEKENYTLSGFESQTSGEKNITIKYKDNENITTSFKVTVKKPDVSNVKSIEITTKPTKLTYYLGEELDLAGMVVTATYTNDDQEAVLGYEVSGFDSETVGEKTITVSYGKTDTFTVTVEASYQDITLAVTVAGLDEYKDTYSKIYINHNFGLNDPNAEWTTEVMTQDENNKNLWTISFTNIETERYYNYNFYFGDDSSANMTYGKNIIDDESQSLQVVRGTTTYDCDAKFLLTNSVKTIDLVIDPSIKATSESETVELDERNYIWVWNNITNNEVLFEKKVDNKWHHSFDIPLVNGQGDLTFTALISENDWDFTWDYVMGAYNENEWEPYSSGYTKTIKSSDPVTVEYDALFNSQPTYGETYTFHLEINVTDTFSNFGYLSFVYNYSNLTESAEAWDESTKYEQLNNVYTWANVSDDGTATKYDFYLENVDSTKPLYFKLCVGDTSDNKTFVGNGGDVNYTITPSSRNHEYASLDLNASTLVASNYTIKNRVKGEMFFGNQITTVYGEPITITPEFTGDSQSFTAQYEGTNIRIDNNKIIGLKAGTVTKVKLVSELGLTCSFYVAVTASIYRASWDRDLLGVNYDENDGNDGVASEHEGWFEQHNVEEISGMGEDFMNGIDISSVKVLYDNGTKFYNADGIEQSLFYILKEHGVDWIRMKLWVDPYTTNGVSYGGGSNDLETDLWIAKEAKAAGLKVLLDFHYSDYWTHPGQQIVPKAWANATSADDLAGMIQTYTSNTLNSFKDNGCLPEMVQLGNEISSGMFIQAPGLDSFTDLKVKDGSDQTYKAPNYSRNNSNFAYSTLVDNSYMNKYIKAASNGVNAVDSNIKRVVHWAKGSQINSGVINSFFNGLDNSDYDYAALSFYPFYCFDTMSAANTILSGLLLSKPWFIAETSYPYSGFGYVSGGTNKDVTGFTISKWYKDSSWHWGGDTSIHTEYEYDAAGQAKLMHDLTATVVANNGIGVFYWEGAWVPNKNVGWSGAGSLNTWGNQGFFSFNGKVLPNIGVFKQMSPHF